MTDHSDRDVLEPRAKLKNGGAAKLSEVELLAIIFQRGAAAESTMRFCEQLLGRFGGIRPLLSADTVELAKIPHHRSENIPPKAAPVIEQAIRFKWPDRATSRSVLASAISEVSSSSEPLFSVGSLYSSGLFSKKRSAGSSVMYLSASSNGCTTSISFMRSQ